MQVDGEKAEIVSGIGEDRCFKNLVDNCLVKDLDGQENSVSFKVECSGTDEHVVENKTSIAVGSRDASDQTTAELGCVEPAEFKYDVHQGDLKSSDGVDEKSDVCITDIKSCGQTENLSFSIKEGLEKVTLVGDGGGFVTDGKSMKEMVTGIVTDDRVSSSESESDSESDSESESSSSSCSTSSASSRSEDDKEETVKEVYSCKNKVDDIERSVDMEDGEIVGSADNMVSWTDNEDDKEVKEEEEDTDEVCEDSELGEFIDDEDSDLPKGPIKSKNELQALPPVPPVDVTLQPSHQISHVGVVSSVLGTQVVVEGSEKHNPLSEGSILWIEESRLPLGIVDEIFGPVKNPYYIVRYNSESEVPPGIESGSAVGFVSEFVGHVLNDRSLYQKGYDASGENDEEVLDEAEFSDDEKEAEYKRMLKMSKRGNNNEGQGLGNKKKNRKQKEKTWAKVQPSSSQSPTVQPSQPDKMQQHSRAPLPSFSQGNQTGASQAGAVFNGGTPGQPTWQGNQSGPSQMGPVFPGGHAFPQLAQPFMFNNGYMGNGMAPRQPNMPMSAGFQMNGAQWAQQNLPQALQMPSSVPAPWQQQQFAPQFPLGNAGPCQQPFNLSQLASGNNVSPLRPMNFSPGAINSPWPDPLNQNLPGQAPFVAGVQNPNVQLPMFLGFSSNVQQPAGQSCNPPPAANDQGSPQFNRGFSSGRGRGRKPFHRGRGCHFGGGRGRKQN